jgi:hypothetical protein
MKDRYLLVALVVSHKGRPIPVLKRMTINSGKLMSALGPRGSEREVKENEESCWLPPDFLCPRVYGRKVAQRNGSARLSMGHRAASRL